MSYISKESEQSNNNHVCLEDLLSLKRHEKPIPEFWEQFDQQLKAKTLQALAKKNKRFSFSMLAHKAFTFVRKPVIPMSAAAVLTVCTLLPQHARSLDMGAIPLFDGGVTHFVQQDMTSSNYADAAYDTDHVQVSLSSVSSVEGCCKGPQPTMASTFSNGGKSWEDTAKYNAQHAQTSMLLNRGATSRIQVAQSFSHIL